MFSGTKSHSRLGSQTSGAKTSETPERSDRNLYGTLKHRRPLFTPRERDPLSKIRGKFDIKHYTDDDGKPCIMVMRHEVYGAVIFQRDSRDQVILDLRGTAREAIKHNDMEFFRELARQQEQALTEETPAHLVYAVVSTATAA